MALKVSIIIYIVSKVYILKKNNYNNSSHRF